MNAVSSSNGDSRFEFMGALLQDVKQSRRYPREDDRGSVADLQRHRRIEYVRRGQAEVEVSRAAGPTYSATEVVNAMTSCFASSFDLVDAIDGEGRLRFEFRRRRR